MHFIIFGNFSAVISLTIASSLYYLLARYHTLVRGMLSILPLFSISINPLNFFCLLFFPYSSIIFSDLSPVVSLSSIMSNFLFHLFIEFLNSVIF